MENSSSPEFSDYIHAIGRRKALLIGIAIPIAILAILLSLTLPDIYTSSALVEIEDSASSQSLASGTQDASYACIRNSGTTNPRCSSGCGATSTCRS
jgi:uncharacterized protein involved in exopolysaccharide biosynthesis